MINGSIWEEIITIIDIYAPNIGAPQYIRQLLTAIKEEIDSNTVIVGDFNTSLTPMDRSSRQKINRETQALNDTIDQIDLIDFLSFFYGAFSFIKLFLKYKKQHTESVKIIIELNEFSKTEPSQLRSRNVNDFCSLPHSPLKTIILTNMN